MLPGRRRQRPYREPPDFTALHRWDEDPRWPAFEGALPPCDAPIPRTLHLIWLGQKRLSELQCRCVSSWLRHNPGWALRLWTEPPFPLTNQALYDQATNPGEAADVLRLEILAVYGGLYVDTDVECLAPVTAVLEGHSFVAGLHQDKTGPMHVENAFLAACAGHPLLLDAVEFLPTWYAANRDGGTVVRSGPRFWESIVRQHRRNLEPGTADGITLLEQSVWSPRNPAEPGPAVCRHWQQKSWI